MDRRIEILRQLQENPSQVIWLAVLALLLYPALTHLSSPLRSVPGPLLAAFSDWWRVASYIRGRMHLKYIALHRKFGPVVRLGPNMVSLSDATLLPIVYSNTDPWLKSDMYASNEVVINGVEVANIFSTRDIAWHKKMIKPLRNMNTVTKTVATWGAAVDDSVRLFCARMDKIAAEGTVVKLEDWLFYFTYDCLYKLTLGTYRGYIETGSDVGGVIKDACRASAYFGLCANMPILDRCLVKNPLVKPFLRKPPFLWAFQQAYKEIAARKAQHEAAQTTPVSADFLDLFLAGQKTYPDVLTSDKEVVDYLILSLLAGSDTTGICTIAIIYYIYRNSHILINLRAELEAAGWNDVAAVGYRESTKLLYLNAVIQEGIRIHSPLGVAIERVVPTGGWQVPGNGPFLPGGTKVGMNPWVTNRDATVFGPENVDEFVPERWLQRPGEQDEECIARVARMKSLMLTFGHGSRACTGKSVAMLQLLKLVGTFVMRYDIEFLKPSWETSCIWFVFPTALDVRVRRREGAGESIAS